MVSALLQAYCLLYIHPFPDTLLFSFLSYWSQNYLQKLDKSLKSTSYIPVFFVYSAPKTALRKSQSIKKARLTYIEKGEKIHSINKASNGTRSGFDALTKGSKKPVFMRVCGLLDPLQNRVPRVRVLLPLPKIPDTGFRCLGFFRLWVYCFSLCVRRWKQVLGGALPCFWAEIWPEHQKSSSLGSLYMPPFR